MFHVRPIYLKSIINHVWSCRNGKAFHLFISKWPPFRQVDNLSTKMPWFDHQEISAKYILHISNYVMPIDNISLIASIYSWHAPVPFSFLVFSFFGNICWKQQVAMCHHLQRSNVHKKTQEREELLNTSCHKMSSRKISETLASKPGVKVYVDRHYLSQTECIKSCSTRTFITQFTGAAWFPRLKLLRMNWQDLVWV